MDSKRSFLSSALKFMVCYDRSKDKNELKYSTMVIDAVNQNEMRAPTSIGFDRLYGLLLSFQRFTHIQRLNFILTSPKYTKQTTSRLH